MKKGLNVIALILVISMMTMVSAGVYFSQPEEYYNVGDTIKVNLTVEPVEEGFPTIILNCGGDSVIVIPNSYNNGRALIEFPLTDSWIEDMSGTCYFSAEFPNEANGKSREFEISKKLDVLLSIESLFAKPGEVITVSGYAKRLNGQGVDGEVEITIPLLSRFEEVVETEVSNESTNQTDSNETLEDEVVDVINQDAYYGQIKGGEFSVDIILPNDIPAGNYRIDALSFEERNGDRTSEGLAVANLQIFQIPTSIDVALSNQNFDPGETLNFKPMLKDQTGMDISEEISVNLLILLLLW